MFSIITNQTIQECSQLERQTSELMENILELQQVTNEVRRLSCMEDPVIRLENIYSEIDFEYSVLRQMMSGLNKVILSYMNCENKICDNGEQNVIQYRRQEIGINDFSGIANILQEL